MVKPRLGLNLNAIRKSLIEFRPKSGCVASPVDGAGNRISRGLSQQARGPTSSPHAGLGASDAVSGCAVSRAARKARRRSQIPAIFRVHRISERH
jgi:hypothetical protein